MPEKARSDMLRDGSPPGDTPKDLETLSRFPYLAELEQNHVEALLKLAMRRRYRKTMVLFLEGEPVDAIHFLLSGRVKLSVTHEDGREQILAIPGPGDFFPHTSFLNGRCGATAQALDDTTTLALKPEDLNRLVSREPAVGLALLAGMAERIRLLEETVRDLSLRTVPGRIARVLLDEARRYGEPAGEGYEFPFRFTQQDLAHLVGASRETVSRTLSLFRREGAIRPGRRGRVYADPNRLQAWR